MPCCVPPLLEEGTHDMKGPSLYLFTTAIATAIGCTSELAEPDAPLPPDDGATCPAQVIDVNRSLFVSPTDPAEQAALRSRFAVSRIMSHILASSGAQR